MRQLSSDEYAWTETINSKIDRSRLPKVPARYYWSSGAQQRMKRVDAMNWFYLCDRQDMSDDKRFIWVCSDEDGRLYFGACGDQVGDDVGYEVEPNDGDMWIAVLMAKQRLNVV